MKHRKKRKFKYIILVAVLASILGTGFYLRFMPSKDTTQQVSIQAVTPATRDDVRKKNLAVLATAMKKIYVAYGRYPFVVPKQETPICNGASTKCKQVKFFDANILVSDGLISFIPSDPSGGKGQYNSGFSIQQDNNGSITLLAPRTEGNESISIKL